MKFDSIKIFIPVILFIFPFIQLNGQSKVMAHLFNDESKDMNLFINPTFQFSEIVLQYCAIPGIRAGVIINNKTTFGALYNFTLNSLPLPETKGSGKLMMKWGGIHFEYTLWPNQKVHLTFPLSVGVGRLKISGNTNDSLPGNRSFLFAEPGLMVEINVWKYAKLGIGTSYRYTANVSYNSLTANDLSGFAATVSAKFGIFNYPESE